ncbi:MAG: sugar phosphate isomerase/epimerase [Anaerolineae bacterium]
MANDFEGVIRKVAAIGYAGVETAGFTGTTVNAAAALFADLGLQVSSMHSPLPLGEDKNQVLDSAGILQCQHLVCAYFPPEKFASKDGIIEVCDKLNEANEIARQNNLTLHYHNHWWEFRQQVDGRPAYKTMLEHLAPTVHFEVDTYWVKTGGHDPAAIVRELGQRVSLLHIKDGSADESQPMVAVGEGIMDWTSIISASSAEWLIVELDRCATEMLEAVSKSYTYLVNKGYAHGK